MLPTTTEFSPFPLYTQINTETDAKCEFGTYFRECKHIN